MTASYNILDFDYMSSVTSGNKDDRQKEKDRQAARLGGGLRRQKETKIHMRQRDTYRQLERIINSARKTDKQTD